MKEELDNLSSNLNRIIYVLDKIFARADSYKIESTHYDDINEDLDIKVHFEVTEEIDYEPGIYCSNLIVGIPEYVLDPGASNTDIEGFIENMIVGIDDEINNLMYNGNDDDIHNLCDCEDKKLEETRGVKFDDPKYPRYRDSYAPEVVEESGYEYLYDDYEELPCAEEERFWGDYIDHMESLGWKYVIAVDWGYNDDTGYSSIEVTWRKKITDETPKD